MTAMVEKDQQQLSPEEMAQREVESYIERTEKQPEVGADVAGVVQPVQPPQIQPISDTQGQVVLQQVPSEPEIELPLTEAEVRDGLHHRIIDSFRWLAEFCVMLIKKYPGRVFYKSEEAS